MKAFGKLIAGNNMRKLIENKTTIELWVKMRRDAHATFDGVNRGKIDTNQYLALGERQLAFEASYHYFEVDFSMQCSGDRNNSGIASGDVALRVINETS
jgi:hypothetical protein